MREAGGTQEGIYNRFISESITRLKRVGTTNVFFKYQFSDIAKAFPNEKLECISVNNYYVINREHNKKDS